jgi:hypothetical protein
LKPACKLQHTRDGTPSSEISAVETAVLTYTLRDDLAHLLNLILADLATHLLQLNAHLSMNKSAARWRMM